MMKKKKKKKKKKKTADPPHLALLDDALVSCGPIQLACSLLFALITCLCISRVLVRHRAWVAIAQCKMCLYCSFILEILCVKQTILGPGKLAGFCSSFLVVFTCVFVAIALNRCYRSLNPQSPRDSRPVLFVSSNDQMMMDEEEEEEEDR